MRDEAGSRLKKRMERSSEPEINANSPREPTIYELLRDNSEKNSELRSQQWQQEQEMHHRERHMEIQDRCYQIGDSSADKQVEEEY